MQYPTVLGIIKTRPRLVLKLKQKIISKEKVKFLKLQHIHTHKNCSFSSLFSLKVYHIIFCEANISLAFLLRSKARQQRTKKKKQKIIINIFHIFVVFVFLPAFLVKLTPTCMLCKHICHIFAAEIIFCLPSTTDDSVSKNLYHNHSNNKNNNNNNSNERKNIVKQQKQQLQITC